MTPSTEPLSTSIHHDGYMVMILSGSLGSDIAEPLQESVRTATQMTRTLYDKSGKVKILFDMETFTGEYSVTALEAMVKFAEDTKPFVYKTACFGGPAVGRVAGEVVAAMSGRDNIHFFKTRDDALSWLNEPVKPE